MTAGLAVTPGPIVVALVAGPAGKLASRVGFPPVLIVGSVFFAGGLAWYLTHVTSTPAYTTDWLPGTLITGFGIGLTFPVLSAAAVSSLPPDRYAIGSAVNQTARQVGGAIGVAILVALLGARADHSEPVTPFDRVWAYCAMAAVGSGIVGGLIPRGQRHVRRSVDADAVLVPEGH